MARREAQESNELKIHDNISDSDVVLYYRMPTTKERQDYQNKALQRKRNVVEVNTAAARLEFGKMIITGVREGDFERLEHGQYVAISSDPGSDLYYADWKDWLQNNAADLVMLLAAHVFDASASIVGEDISGK